MSEAGAAPAAPAPEPPSQASSHLLVALSALAVVVILVAWIARSVDGQRLVAEADAALARGDRVEAIVLARAATEARCPGCSAPDTGYARLEVIAKDAETRADDATAVAAWRAVRAASLATSVLGVSGPQRERADAEIARLEHRIDVAAGAAGGTASPAATEPRLRAALTETNMPAGSVFAVVTLGTIVFALGAIRFARARRFAPTELGLAILGTGLAIAGVVFF